MITGGPTPLSFDTAGFHVHQVAAPYDNAMTFSQRLKSFLLYVWNATLLAVRTPTDVVFATSTPITTAIPGLVASILRRRPLVFEVRDLWPSVPARLGIIKSRPLIHLAQVLERTVYRRATSVIALSPSMAEGILQTEPLADVHIIPNSCDLELFRVSDAERSKLRSELGWLSPVAIYAGSFGTTYRIDWLVQVAAACSTVRLQIVGEGASTQAAQALARQLGLDATFLLPGKLPKTEVAKRVAASDIVLSSLQNVSALGGNSLNKVFDAMAAGRPVAFNHDGWLSDLLCRQGAGWRLPDDPIEAARTLEAICGDLAALTSHALAAGTLGAAQFSRDDLYRDFRDVLDTTAQEHRPRPDSK